MKNDPEVLGGIQRWIASLPRNSRIKWTSYDLTHEGRENQGGEFPWADIEVPELLRELEVAWLWTVVLPSDPQASVSDLQIAIPMDTAEEWNPTRISEGLNEWVRFYVDRDDIRFEFDPAIRSTMKAFYELALSGAGNETERVQINDNVFAAPQALESLQEMPAEDAQEITSRMQEVVECVIRENC